MKLISISGSGRSGSTFLSLLLTQNDDVFNLGQSRDFGRAYVQGAHCSCGDTLGTCAVWSPVVQRVCGIHPEHSLTTTQHLMGAYRNDAESIPDWTDGAALTRLANRHASYIDRLGAFLSASAEVTGVEALLDTSKSPEVALAFSLTGGADVRVLNLLRDPRAVVVSWEKKWGREAAIRYSHIWGERQRRLLRWSEVLGERFLQVRYEDLVASPRQMVEQILAWAELRPSPALFTSDHHAEVSWARQHLFFPTNETVLSDKRTGVDVLLASAWRKPENSYIHRMVEANVGNLMEQFGYQRIFKEIPSPPQPPSLLHSIPKRSSVTPPDAGIRAQDRNFVFLICSERSGANLISQLLGCHSGVTTPPPYHLCRDIGANLHTMLGLDTSARVWQQMKERLLARVQQLKSKTAAEQLALHLGSTKSIAFGELARFVFCELEDVAAGATVFVKENELHRMLFFILQYFPQARFVFQVRDPRDYLLSADARRTSWMGNKFGSDRHALEVWRADQIGGLSALAHLGPGRVFLQRYEDLISHPQVVLSSLCAFLGLDFEPGMLDFYKTEAATRLAQPGNPRENLNKPLMANNSGEYRNGLSKRQIRMVETCVGDLMQRFGYQRDFPQTREPSLFQVFMPQISEPLERFMNGEIQPFYTQDQMATNDSGAAPLALPYAAASERVSSVAG
jgi:hypothetical protein